MNVPIEITCTEVKELLDQQTPLTLLDCREPQEYALVAIPGAALLPTAEFPEAVHRLRDLQESQETPLVVFCHHGMRSAQLTQWLRSQGFENAQSMAGGIDRWAREIEPGMTRY